jgi:phage antirepressor YoqD-like protein
MLKVSIESEGSENALMESRSLRDRYADQVDALEKVGKLTMLPDDLHVTLEMAANFFKVDKEAVKKSIQRNRDELDTDGIKKVLRNELYVLLGQNVPKEKIPVQALLLPRRAVLRIGMLLRDSEVAKALRSYLLNVEEIARREAPKVIKTALEKLPEDYEEALEQLLIQVRENKMLTAEVETIKADNAIMAPKAERFDDLINSRGSAHIGDIAKTLNFEDMGPKKLFSFLREKKVLMKNWKSFKNIPLQSYVNAGYFRVKYRPVENVWGDKIGEVATTFVTPKGAVFIRDLLLKNGYEPKGA